MCRFGFLLPFVFLPPNRSIVDEIVDSLDEWTYDLNSSFGGGTNRRLLNLLSNFWRVSLTRHTALLSLAAACASGPFAVAASFRISLLPRFSARPSLSLSLVSLELRPSVERLRNDVGRTPGVSRRISLLWRFSWVSLISREFLLISREFRFWAEARTYPFVTRFVGALSGAATSDRRRLEDDFADGFAAKAVEDAALRDGVVGWLFRYRIDVCPASLDDCSSSANLLARWLILGERVVLTVYFVLSVYAPNATGADRRL